MEEADPLDPGHEANARPVLEMSTNSMAIMRAANRPEEEKSDVRVHTRNG